MKTSNRYYSYLLRLWNEGSGDSVIWRITLEVPQTHQIMNFNSLTSMMEFLEERISPGKEDDEKRMGRT